MLSYIEIALINAAMIVPLALLAEVAGRAFRRPALTHLLWVLILVKLMTPPVWQVPLVERDWLISTGRQLLTTVFTDVDRIELGRLELSRRLPRVSEEMSITAKPKPRPRTLAERDKRLASQRISFLTVAATWVRSENVRQLVSAGLLMVWALGALSWFGVQGFRCVRFRWSLARGMLATPELQQFSNQLSHRLGLSRSPTVWLMPGVMSPMLWGTGQSTLLIFPEPLLDRLDPDAAGTLLTHELAHYRRRDHWVRIVALIATGFFWWHPIVWWARRQIEAVEEECCDALVLKAAAAPPKRYAEAILETVDFLAEFQLRLPPLATGLGQVPFLRQRLTWIMRGPRQQDLGYCGRMLCSILACTLPLQPTWIAARSPVSIPGPTSPVSPPGIDMSPPASPSSRHSEDRLLADIAVVPPAQSETPMAPLPWSGFEVRSNSSDGRFAVLGNKSIQTLLDLKTGRDFDLSDFVITAMAFASNTNQFVTIGADGFLRLWNAETCEVGHGWQIPGGPSKSVDLSPDGRWIATGGRDGVIRIWNVSSPQPIRELPRELAPVNCVRFSPSGDLLAVATGDWMSPQTGRIALFDVGQWTERISMNWNSPAAAVAFRADGESLTSGDWQGRVARWSVASGELLGLSDGHKDLMAAAEFSPDGSPLAEIDVPDLRPDAAWGEAEPSGQFSWFFGGWSLKSTASPMAPPTPRSLSP